MTRPVITAEPRRILITGTRIEPTVRQRDQISAHLMTAVDVGPEVEIVFVHGACPTGVDAFVDEWARRYGAIREPHPARDFGSWPSCGPKRNAHMVSLGADLCLGFPGPASRGTWDCLRRAVDAGIPTRAYSLGGAA